MRALKIWGMTMVVVIAVLGLYIYQNNREYQIILLNTNDSHGSILPVDSVGGMAERATFIRMVREKNPYVLLVDAGDINTGQAISNRADAKPDILAYNYMGYDAVTVGNHEFDKPLNVLLKQMQWAEFPFVTSNSPEEAFQLNGHRYAPTLSPYPTQESIQLQARQRISSLPDL